MLKFSSGFKLPSQLLDTIEHNISALLNLIIIKHDKWNVTRIVSLNDVDLLFPFLISAYINSYVLLIARMWPDSVELTAKISY